MTDITKISRFSDLRNIGDVKARADIADSFSTSTTYTVGDLSVLFGTLGSSAYIRGYFCYTV